MNSKIMKVLRESFTSTNPRRNLENVFIHRQFIALLLVNYLGQFDE